MARIVPAPGTRASARTRGLVHQTFNHFSITGARARKRVRELCFSGIPLVRVSRSAVRGHWRARSQENPTSAIDSPHSTGVLPPAGRPGTGDRSPRPVDRCGHRQRPHVARRRRCNRVRGRRCVTRGWSRVQPPASLVSSSVHHQGSGACLECSRTETWCSPCMTANEASGWVSMPRRGTFSCLMRLAIPPWPSNRRYRGTESCRCTTPTVSAAS